MVFREFNLSKFELKGSDCWNQKTTHRDNSSGFDLKHRFREGQNIQSVVSGGTTNAESVLSAIWPKHI